MNSPVLVWFRHDLRLADNPALTEALILGRPIIPVFIWAPQEEDMGVGAATRWWLHHSLSALSKQLEKGSSRLIIRVGNSVNELQSLIQETGATHVFWNRRYEPAIINRDTKIKTLLNQSEIQAKSFKATLQCEPWQSQTKTGKPFQVFTHFWESAKRVAHAETTFPAPTQLPAPETWPSSIDIEELDLLPRQRWAEEFQKIWTPGETGAQKACREFIKKNLVSYAQKRDFVAHIGTSRLSPHLHFGEISVRQIWNDIQTAIIKINKTGLIRSAEIFLKELGWREFAHHLLYHFPKTVHEPLRSNFHKFPWSNNVSWLKAWQKGQTGFPIVDAGMRELWKTGWMHNRVRMIVASFLVKDCRIAWQHGAAWFWECLLDADLANNTLGWQWSAGCGADAAPYFRIFNPTLQAERFDAEGLYVRTWIPELAALPNKWIHEPSKAPAEILKKANIVLGKTYPFPILEHGQARQKALQAFQQIKNKPVA